jgi:hypothetical protein
MLRADYAGVNFWRREQSELRGEGNREVKPRALPDGPFHPDATATRTLLRFFPILTNN